jgi:phosphate transport system protein
MTAQRSSTAGGAEPHSSEFRATFHRDLERLELDLHAMSALARAGLQRATRALVVDDQALRAAVVAGDDEVDRRYLDIERRVIGLLARQAPRRRRAAAAHRHPPRQPPPGTRRRHGGEHRRLAQLAAGTPRKPAVARHLEEMGGTTVCMVDLAMQSFRDRDAEGCQRLPMIDDRVDELNRSMLAALLAAGEPFQRLEWGVHMYEAARQPERAGDHAVDIAEQVWFLVTGELQEFGDATRAPARARSC